jgi:hypothetical protein
MVHSSWLMIKSESVTMNDEPSTMNLSTIAT